MRVLVACGWPRPVGAAVHAGSSEMDIAAALTRGVYALGAEHFKLMIVATGERSQLPNVGPSERRLQVRDVCRVAAALLEAPRDRIHNVAVNVGRSSENYRIRDVAEIVHDAVPGSSLSFAEGAGPDLRNYRADFSKVKRLLPGFAPQWDARKGAIGWGSVTTVTPQPTGGSPARSS